MADRPGDRKKLRLEIDGRETFVSPGTTVAAAVWGSEQGIGGLRRSVTGQSRGPLCGMGICFECRVELDGQAHVRSCNVSCREGMVVRTASAKESGLPVSPDPSPSPSSGPSGFGRGPGPWRAAPAQVEASSPATVRCEVVVIGGGPAGVAAAVTAAEAGVRVVLVDDNPALGGQIWRHRPAGRAVSAPPPARRWLGRLGAVGVERLCPATVVDAEPAAEAAPFTLLLETPRGPRKVVAPRLILATGAMERFLPFPGWTLPGVVGAGGLQALIKGGLDVEGLRVVVAGSGPLLLAVAHLARRSGARVLAVAEQASAVAVRRLALGLWADPRRALQALGLGWGLGFGLPGLGVPVRFGCWPLRVEGEGALERVVLGGDRPCRGLPCDLLACAFGLVPSLELALYLGCAVEPSREQPSALGGERVRVDEHQRTSVPGIWAAGELTGVGGVDLALVEGRIAGASAAGVGARSLSARRDREQRYARSLERAFVLRPELRRLADEATVVCRCEDVTWGRIRRHRERAADRGGEAADLRGLKLETRCGMGPCQGRVCGSALEFLSEDFPSNGRGEAGEDAGPRGRLHVLGRPPIFPTHLETLMRLGATEKDRS